MAGSIFISYRHDEAEREARYLATVLRCHFWTRRIFLDKVAIGSGEDWRRVLMLAIEASDAMVVIIGPNWLNGLDSQGKRRIDDPNDVVRLEIERAFLRSIPILPVLINDSEMPKNSALPREVAKLGEIQAKKLRVDSLCADAIGAALRLRRMLSQWRSGVRASLVMLIALASFVAGIGVGPLVLISTGLPIPLVNIADAECSWIVPEMYLARDEQTGDIRVGGIIENYGACQYVFIVTRDVHSQIWEIAHQAQVYRKGEWSGVVQIGKLAPSVAKLEISIRVTPHERIYRIGETFEYPPKDGVKPRRPVEVHVRKNQ